MTKEQALRLFYDINRIDPLNISKPDSPEYDEALMQLPDKLDDWLSAFDPADSGVFLEALSRYTYLTETECQIRFAKLIEILEADLARADIDLEQTMFVTVESSGGMKSGGDNVRVDLQRRNIRRLSKSRIVAAQSRLINEQLTDTSAVVFVDDIIGSGQTVWNELHTFCNRFGINGESDVKLYCLCLSPTEKGLRHLKSNFAKNGYSVTFIYKNEWLCKRAFDGSSGEYRSIDKYEKLIDEYFAGAGHSYRMGFKKGCNLISFYYNTPNNTISSFWRPTPFNKPPFLRDGKECVRPNVSDLKDRKKQSDLNAYSFAEIRRK